MNKKALSERDICTKFITPNIVTAGWNVDTQIREEVSFTDGRIYVRGKIHARGAQKRADYILYYKPNIPIAALEAKDNNHTVGAGTEYFAHAPIPLPPLAEQAAIVAQVEALMVHCGALAAEIAHTRTHAAHLLQAVIKEAFAPPQPMAEP